MTEQSVADIFYPPENATTDTDTPSSTPVEAEAVEVEKSASVEVADKPDESNDSDADKAADVESESKEVESSDDSDDEPLFFQLGDKEISIAEVKEGIENGLRQSDYTRKTQVLSEDRKAFDLERAKNGELSELLTSHIESLEHSFKKEEAEIDWEHLREYDPSEFLKQKEEQAKKVDSLDAAKAEVQKLNDEKRTAHITTEQKKLIEAFPEWVDPATGKEAQEKDAKLIEGYALNNGFTDEDLKQLDNSNVMIAIHKAAQFDELKKKGDEAEKVVRKAPKAIKPGPRKTKTKPQSAAELFYGTK